MRGSNLLSSTGKLAAIALSILPGINAISYTSVSSPNLDLSQLGRVALAGDFDSIDLYTYEGQTEDSYTTNGSQSLLARYPNGAFDRLAMSDAYIETMCPFVVKSGALHGVVVGGNFTSLGGVQAQGIAFYNPNTSAITALPGLSGRVSSVYCDQETSTIYVGGSFTGANSSNAIAWTNSVWTNLPFEGFNGPVTSITKSSNGTIIFGGSFTGLGNTTSSSTSMADKDRQVINLGSGNITSGGSTTTSGYSDPSNIICKVGSEQGSGNTWLLADDTAGYWKGSFGFGFNPTKLRIYNTNLDGRGTKTFRFTAMPIDGIMNLTYVDSDGQNATCTADCPLPQGNTTYQDFTFVNVIGMNGFRIDISAWYGSGGGLDGIEVFQDDIYSFAISDFNEPKCDGVSSTGANSTTTGTWAVTPSGTSTSDYLTATLEDGTTSDVDASVIFEPDIKQSGNYSIMLYTPGCINDDTCSSRGIVNITGTMTSDGASISDSLYQTNNYDKYDQIYFGYVDASSDSFRPTVTLAPASGQDGPLTVVAQRVRFEIISSSGGLNGLYEYNPNEATVSTDYSSSAVNVAGMDLDSDAVVNSLAVYDTTTFVAGNFSATGLNNIFSIVGGTTTALAGNGLNAEVLTMYLNGSTLYVGGNFTNTAESTNQDLSCIAAYSIKDKAWKALGAGVNGPVWSIVPLTLNVTGNDNQTVLVLSGAFTEVYATESNSSFSANGIAVWVPTQQTWLQDISGNKIEITGELIAQTEVPGFETLYAGTVMLENSGMSDAVALTGSGSPSLESLGLNIAANTQSTSTVSKRSLSSSQNITGVATGFFYVENNMNITILGGNFVANASNGSEIYNFAVINDTSSQTITGLPSTIDSDSQFLSMDRYETNLYAGGVVTGTVDDNDVDGLIVYNLATGELASTQPPALSGDSTVSVNAVAAQPSGSYVYVGGSFSKAGSLSCETLCSYDASRMQWMSPGSGLSGTISAMLWTSSKELVIAGNLTVEGNTTTMATYNSKKQTFTDFPGATSLPGPINDISAADSAYGKFWVTGTRSTGNQSYYLAKYDGSTWIEVGGLGNSTSIRGLQLMTVTSNHDSSSLVDNDKVLLITGSIDVPNYGNASAVLFNGTTYEPFVLTSMDDGSEGTLANMFVQNPGNFLTHKCEFIPKTSCVLQPRN